MALAPFASLQSRVNRAVQQRLANATATYQGGEPFGVLFERASADPYGTGEVDASSYTAGFCIANAPGLQRGGTLVIDGATYQVASDVTPDAGGWVSLTLFKA